MRASELTRQSVDKPDETRAYLNGLIELHGSKGAVAEHLKVDQGVVRRACKRLGIPDTMPTKGAPSHQAGLLKRVRVAVDDAVAALETAKGLCSKVVETMESGA